MNVRCLWLVLGLVSLPRLQAGGSWGGEVGGSLRRFEAHLRWIDLAYYRPSFLEASLYHVHKEAGLGVEHEFLGLHIRWQTSKGFPVERWFTTGLVANGDEVFFRDLVERSDHRRLRKIRVYDDFAQLRTTIGDINTRMCSHPARHPCMLGFVMAMTPLLGQPCSNAVRDILDFIGRSPLE